MAFLDLSNLGNFGNEQPLNNAERQKTTIKNLIDL